MSYHVAPAEDAKMILTQFYAEVQELAARYFRQGYTLSGATHRAMLEVLQQYGVKTL